MTESSLLEYLKKKPLLLAPMAGVTDYPFRSFMKELDCGILTTELVSAVALVRDETERTRKIAQIDSCQRPIGIQIFGEDPTILAEAAVKVEALGADFVDLNLGCPVPKIVKKGAGSALLKNLPLLSQILQSIRKKITIPLTIKVRTGWDEGQRNALETAQAAKTAGCLWMTIHGRTRAQGYSGLADWNYISEVKSKAPLPIIGNGDLVNPYQTQQVLLKTQCDGLMIGRGALRNPWIFQEAYHFIHNTKLVKRDYPLLLKNLYNHLNSFYEERMALIQFKKFVTWFSHGCPGSTQFRKLVFQQKEQAVVVELALKYFQKLTEDSRNLKDYPAFLLQGHG